MEPAILEARFKNEKALSFHKREDLIFVDVTNDLASASICLQGAQVTDWVPQGEQGVIWISDNSYYQTAKSIRGGVPVCWPWFGNHATNEEYPAHGFVRNKLWSLDKVESLPDGANRLLFSYTLDESDRAMWPYPCALQLVITIGKQLELCLQTHNTGNESFQISEAMHTYFNVADVSQVSVAGLDCVDYLDKVEAYKQKTQSGAIKITAEVDRVYMDTASTCCIEDPLMLRTIVIHKEHSLSTIVWNPWKERSLAMADMGEQAYRGMLCVESANAAGNTIQLAGGDKHVLKVSYQIERHVQE